MITAPVIQEPLVAGKDVYVEKPASHHWWEGRQLVRAVEKSSQRAHQRQSSVLRTLVNRSSRSTGIDDGELMGAWTIGQKG